MRGRTHFSSARVTFIFFQALLGAICIPGVDLAAGADLPEPIRVVIDNTKPLVAPRGSRLPLFVLPISQSLASVDLKRTESVLRALVGSPGTELEFAL